MVCFDCLECFLVQRSLGLLPDQLPSSCFHCFFSLFSFFLRVAPSALWFHISSSARVKKHKPSLFAPVRTPVRALHARRRPKPTISGVHSQLRAVQGPLQFSHAPQHVFSSVLACPAHTPSSYAHLKSLGRGLIAFSFLAPLGHTLLAFSKFSWRMGAPIPDFMAVSFRGL